MNKRQKFIQTKAIIDMLAERKRQDEKWAEQNHHPTMWITILSEEIGEASKEALNMTFPSKVASKDWIKIHRKEWINKFREEMVQVAAVAIATIESLDRNRKKHLKEKRFY